MPRLPPRCHRLLLAEGLGQDKGRDLQKHLWSNNDTSYSRSTSAMDLNEAGLRDDIPPLLITFWCHLKEDRERKNEEEKLCMTCGQYFDEQNKRHMRKEAQIPVRSGGP